jgi:chlorite dismutase
LLAFAGCADPQPLAAALAAADIPSVVYTDIADPTGVAVLSWAVDPVFFTGPLRDCLATVGLQPKPEMTMFSRTYAQGHERDLEHWLLQKPVNNVMDDRWNWAVWYPLRRTGAFARLPADEQRQILMEHGTIGRRFGAADIAHDVRLASYGIDRNDNDFVIGLIGPDLYGLSAVVQSMRSTVQTSTYVAAMGPFFVGRAVARHNP